jgi:hypothetical protein
MPGLKAWRSCSFPGVEQAAEKLNVGRRFERYGLQQAAEKLHPAGTKRQGTTSVVPIKPIK